VQGEYYPRLVLRWKNIKQADLLFIAQPTHAAVVFFLQPNFPNWIALHLAVLHSYREGGLEGSKITITGGDLSFRANPSSPEKNYFEQN